MLSNCGHDENGKYSGGKAGDQTGTEYAMIAWYNRPWNCVLRHPNEAVGVDLAKVATAAAQNNLVGYDQGQRGTYHQHLKASAWDPSKITIACEADCSSSTAANIIAVGHRLGIKELQVLSPGLTTSGLRKACKAAGFEVLTDSKYLTSDKYLRKGDIPLYEGHHVAINTTNGSQVGGTTVDASGLCKKLQSAAYKDAAIAGTYKTTCGLNLRYGAGKDKYASVVVMPEGTKCKCYGYYSKDSSGKKWYLVIATVNGKQLTGFAHSGYLKK